MQGKPPKNRDRRGATQIDRRGSAPRPGTLKWIKSKLVRPLSLRRGPRHWELVLVERRAKVRREEVPPQQIQDELRRRLLALNDRAEAQVMRQLVAAHGVLVRRGWSALGLWPSQDLLKVQMQAEMLAGSEVVPELQRFIDRVRLLRTEAELREERMLRAQQAEFGRQVDVSEASHEEFEEMERSWTGTMAPPVPEDSR